MLALRPEAFGLNFGDLLVRRKLPPLPLRFGHVFGQPKGGFGMLGNDIASNCVCAGAMHESQTHAMATKRPVPRFSEATGLREYSKLLVAGGGKSWDPRDQGTDLGLNPQLVAGYRRRIGIVDDDGVAHKILAYALVRDLNDAMYGTFLMGAVGLGLLMPDSAERQFADGHVWDDLRSRPQEKNGHYVVMVDRNSAGNLVLLTWGRLHAATPQYVERYWAGAIAYISLEYMLASGVSPEGFDRGALEDYLRVIS